MLATFTMAVPRLDHSVAIVLHVQVHPVRWYHVDRFGEVVADACCKLAWYKHTIRSRGWRSAPGVDSQDVLTKIGSSENGLLLNAKITRRIRFPANELIS